MEIFCFNAAKPREELDSFNHRLRVFCQDNLVVGCVPSALGPSLILSLTMAEDVDLPASNSIAVQVLKANGLDDRLEEHLGNEALALGADSTDSAPFVPFQAQAIPRADLPTEGFCVVSVINGGIEENDFSDGEDL